MSYARQMLDAYPGQLNADAGVLAATIDALSDCAQACAADVDADMRSGRALFYFDHGAPDLVACTDAHLSVSHG